MTEPDFSDPRAFRWVEPGISGLARPSEWDAVALADAPELAALEVDTIEYRCHRGGALVCGASVPRSALETLDRAVGRVWDERPYAATARRESATRWRVGVRELDMELVRLPGGLAASTLQVVVPPDGEREYAADEQEVGHSRWAAHVGSRVVEALVALEELGRARFQAFVATADRVEGDLWEARVDPL